MLELRRGDEVTRSWPESDLVAALTAFWNAVLEEGVLYDRWHRTRLSLPGRGDVAAPGNQPRELKALGVRRREPGFLAAIAARHAQLIDQPLVLRALLELEPNVPQDVQQVVDLLRHALSLTEPLRHLGLRGEGLSADGAPFTLLEEHGFYPNGAGTMTSSSAWQLDVRSPVRLEVLVEASDEEGAPTIWTIKVSSQVGTPIQPLLDAFKEQELYLRHVVRELGP